MKNSKETVQYATNLAIQYGSYDSHDEFDFHLSKVPSYEIDHLCGLMMLDRGSDASEITGPDNDFYSDAMLSSFIETLLKSTDRDAQIMFVKTWKKGARKYLENQMEEMILDIGSCLHRGEIWAA